METEFNIKEYQSYLLKMMKVFDSFCRDHNLKYSLCGGSLLGAVRHKGFIPWDDDIDVMMPRPDYNKLLELSALDFPHGYSIVFAGNKPYYYLPIAKMIDNNTCLIETQRTMKCPIGVNIDIFPVDAVPEESKKQLSAYKKFRSDYKKASLTASYFPLKLPFVNGKLKLGILYNYFVCRIHKLLFDSKSIFRNMDLLVSAESWEEGNKCRIYGSYQFHNRLFEISIFKNFNELEFEDAKFMCIEDYDTYLKSLYKDYMKLPPVEKRVCHHGHYFLDMNRGYSVEELKKMSVII